MRLGPPCPAEGRADSGPGNAGTFRLQRSRAPEGAAGRVEARRAGASISPARARPGPVARLHGGPDMEEAPSRRRTAAQARRRADVPIADRPNTPKRIRVYVPMDREFHRKLATWCAWHGTTIAALVQAHLEPIVRGLVVQHRAGANPPIGVEAQGVRLAEDLEGAEARKAG